MLAIQTSAGAVLFACAVGEGAAVDDWAALEGMIGVVRRTGHASYYVEKGLGAAAVAGARAVVGGQGARGGVAAEYRIHGGGMCFLFCEIAGADDVYWVLVAFPIYLEVRIHTAIS